MQGLDQKVSPRPRLFRSKRGACVRLTRRLGSSTGGAWSWKGGASAIREIIKGGQILPEGGFQGKQPRVPKKLDYIFQAG